MKPFDAFDAAASEVYDDLDEDYYRPSGCTCPEPFIRHDEGYAGNAARATQRSEGTPRPTTAPAPRRRLVDTEAAALLAGCSARTIRRWATTEGRLCVYGTRKRLLVDLDEVVELCRLLERAPAT
jgi:hypothetical protein